MINKFLTEKIDGIEQEAGYEGLKKELDRCSLYLSRMRSDKNYVNNISMQESFGERQEYINELKSRIKKYEDPNA